MEEDWGRPEPTLGRGDFNELDRVESLKQISPLASSAAFELAATLSAASSKLVGVNRGHCNHGSDTLTPLTPTHPPPVLIHKQVEQLLQATWIARGLLGEWFKEVSITRSHYRTSGHGGGPGGYWLFGFGYRLWDLPPPNFGILTASDLPYINYRPPFLQ